MDTGVPFEIRCTRKEMAGGGTVTLNGRKLPLHLDICNHSPDGFNWGYGGSGPSQLAFCIVFEYLLKVEGLTRDRAINRTHLLYQNFKWKLIAGLRNDTETLSKELIKANIDELEMNLQFGA